MRVSDAPSPVLYLPPEREVEGLYLLEVASYFRRPIRGHTGIHARMVVLAKYDQGVWDTDTLNRGDSVTRPFSMDEMGLPWFLSLLKAVGYDGDLDVKDDDAVTRAIVHKPFVGKVRVSEPKSTPSGPKRFVNVVRFEPVTQEASEALAKAST